MKIYNKYLKLDKINDEHVKQYNYNTRSVSYILSKKAIYRIYDNRDLHEIIINDDKIEEIEDYVNDQTHLIDYTIIKKRNTFVSNIPVDHIKRDIIMNYYSLRKNSPIVLVIEKENDNIVDFYFMLRDTYAAYSDADIYNPFILEDIKQFYSLIKL